MTPDQKKGEHGTTATKIVGGVVVNADTESDSEDASSWTKGQLIAYLDENGIEHSSSMTKAELLDLMP